jgi:hypothetical protein
MRHALLVLTLVAALVAPAASAQSTPTVSLTLERARAVYGTPVGLAGRVEPAAAGETVVIELVRRGIATELARAVTDAAGAFAATVTPEHSGVVQARLLSSGAVSAPAAFELLPAVDVVSVRGRAFVSATLRARVRPATYASRVVVVVRTGQRVVATATAVVRNGRLRATLPAPAAGKLVLILTLPATAEFAARTVRTSVQARARTIWPGATGADVRGLARRLAELRFRVPAVSSTYSYELFDAVIAFQKAYGLPRTGTVGPATWRKLGRVGALRPRHRSPGDHIEVDKARQILLDVRDGDVVAILPVSTGATGNTPEGRHRIRWKAPATTTWLGSGILYRTLTFVGDSFAIHGWPDVPAYPASHGCVRIPIWTADWLYNRSPVGRTVYVHS